MLAAFELMHNMRRKTKGKKGWFALKLDMSKAYDCVEWGFLEAMMHKLGILERWVSLISGCIPMASFSFLLNRVPYGKITPQHGLRQGCPLSPYLFLLCAQGLSAMLHGAEVDNLIFGIFMLLRRTKGVTFVLCR